jgi:hypothetical protein
MKIERKVKNMRRDKKLRKNRLTKRTKRKQSFKYYNQSDEQEANQTSAENSFPNNSDHEESNSSSLFNKAITNKLTNILSLKMLVAASLAIIVIVVSLNITPIIKYALQDQNSAIYPILKKYADELRGISNKLTVVTRRLNMLSLVSEENELMNTTRINNLVLQINEMWFTTKKYLNFIGIETIARTELEKEIDANSKINDKGLIRETKAEEIFPKEELTLTNVLKLDSIVQNLNTQIDNINNEITFLEDNVYASIKASHIYSHLLERSRNANGNYYASSAPQPNNVKIEITKRLPVNKSLLSSESVVIRSVPVTQIKKLTVAKKVIPQKQVIALAKPVITNNVVPTKTKSAKKITNKKQAKIKRNKKKSQKIVVAKVRVREPIKKIVGTFTIKDTKISKNNTGPKTNNKKLKEKSVKEAFENTFLLDDNILGFVTTFDDYGNVEEEIEKVNGVTPPEEEDDYTGG